LRKVEPSSHWQGHFERIFCRTPLTVIEPVDFEAEIAKKPCRNGAPMHLSVVGARRQMCSLASTTPLTLSKTVP